MKRFWKEAAAVRSEAGWHVELDGRRVKTQGGRALVVPTETAALLLAGEWAAQGPEIDPRSFRHRDLADYAIDVVGEDREAALASLIRFAETDTLCYRADPDEPLWKRQQAEWEPLLAAAEARDHVRFQRVSGVMHKPQPPETLSALGARLAGLGDFQIAALTTLASLAASLVVALAALAPGADGEALWRAAELEEDWQAELWGRDWEAEERRAKRQADFLSAIAFLRSL